MTASEYQPDLIDLESPEGWAVRRIAEMVRDAGGRAWVVGGSVRDALLGSAPKDFDLEVYGVPAESLEQLLAQFFSVEVIGKSFGVFLIKGHPIDVSLPRRERKEGSGHKGFQVEGDPEMLPEEAVLRRDFTVNALLWDPLTGELLDAVNGLSDLRAGRLAHLGHQFSEDPLRVLRAMQLAARFEFTVARQTVVLCRGIEPEGLPAERLFEEWKKLLIKGRRPSLGLLFLKDSGWLHYFPELAALDGCPQDPEWHPEGDVFIHTALCLDAFARERTGDEYEDLVVGFAVLCHDMGKPATTEFFNERIRSHEHEQKGEPPARSFLERLTRHKKLIEDVVPLVREHMRPREFFLSGAGNSAIRRLAGRVKRIDRLLRVARADMNGRIPLPPTDFVEGQWLEQKAEELAVENAAPRPIIQGRHLMRLGLKPGRHFKPILDKLFEAQIEGKFGDEASGIELARKVLKESGQNPSSP